MEKIKVICFGEVLFDKFPNATKIGGAPLNVGLRMQSLGCNINFISAVGNDQDGSRALKFLQDLGLSTKHFQITNNYPTGEAIVTLDEQQNATYEIRYPVAWDNIALDENAIRATSKADVFIYGTLAARDLTSRSTLMALLTYAKYRVLDLNLRPPHYHNGTLHSFMEKANFIKMSEEEFHIVSVIYDFQTSSAEDAIIEICKQTNTQSMCVTKGSKGALLYHENAFYYNPGYPVAVVDTVGAGDSFLAGLITKLITENNPQEALDFACAVGALVAQSSGSNPILKPKAIHQLMTT
ncbi:carbohydrate kinase family protein [Flagellimonas sp.]|uniref:carbohydrate kinase family protein n=1 Tax=Flagellimonas sp. TaxID=2058762 RepID=UPI003B52167C